MTWKEFKAEVERHGVKDDDVIAYIDTNPSLSGGICVDRYQRKDGDRFRFTVE